MKARLIVLPLLAACSGTPAVVDSTSAALHAGGAILPRLSANPTHTDDTVPQNGDVNPYGVAFVPRGFPSGGAIDAGDLLMANFNNSQNLQGTGTTVVRVRNDGLAPVVFYADSSAPGFSTALGVLRSGFVVLGNVPSSDGTGVCSGNEDNVGSGSLMIIDRHGGLVQRLTTLDGPWDLAVSESEETARVFVSNVKTGTVARIDIRTEEGRSPSVVGQTQIASGYTHRCDPAAFVVGPTGLAFDAEDDVLYIASTGDNAIFSMSHAAKRSTDGGMGSLVVQDATHFHGPLGLVRARNGNLISAQGDAVNPDPNQPSGLVEVTMTGAFVAQRSVDAAAGSAFGLALEQHDDGFRFAAVDDGLNMLDVWVR
jgi:hypothetical protein